MAIREAAFASMEKAASNMKSRAFRKDGHNVDIAIGTMVQMNAAEVDRAKTDVATITGVVVEHRHMEDVLHYRVAAHAGVLKALYVFRTKAEPTQNRYWSVPAQNRYQAVPGKYRYCDCTGPVWAALPHARAIAL